MNLPSDMPAELRAKIQAAIEQRQSEKKQLIGIIEHPNFRKYADAIYSVMRKAQKEDLDGENRERFITACLFAAVSVAMSDEVNSEVFSHLLHKFTSIVETVANTRIAEQKDDGFTHFTIETLEA
jgi:hypothetical protein